MRYIVEDEEMFLLVAPDLKNMPKQSRGQLIKKVKLKNVEAVVDRSEPRCLLIGIADYVSGP